MIELQVASIVADDIPGEASEGFPSAATCCGGRDGNDRMFGLCVGRSYCDNGKRRWNL